MKAKDYLLFDLDGTLSDPLKGIAGSINYALAAWGYPVQPESSLARFIGPPLDSTFAELARTNASSHIMELVEKFRERFKEKGYRENKLYPGIVRALEDLEARQIPMAVCTSKRKDFAQKVITLFGLDHFFDFISGGDVGISKGQQIRELLDRGTISRASIMIGDRNSDIKAGQENGLDAWGVLWGYGSREELETSGADRLFETPDEWKDIQIKSN